jgi:hypothetical protein
VVAGRGGDERGAIGRLVLRHAEDRVERAADLVGERRLEGLELEADRAAGNGGEPPRLAERRPDDVPLYPDGRRADVVSADQAGPDPPARRISASCAANAERAIT